MAFVSDSPGNSSHAYTHFACGESLAGTASNRDKVEPDIQGVSIWENSQSSDFQTVFHKEMQFLK